MLKTEIIKKPIQIASYLDSEPIKLVPDYVASENVNILSASINVHNNAIVLLTAQDNSNENGMYKYNGTSLSPYYFQFFANIKKLYKVTKDSSYILYNGPTDNFNQFDTIHHNDTIIVINKPNVDLPYDWYSYDIIPEPKIRFNREIIKNNFGVLGTVYDDISDNIIYDLNDMPSKPIVLTSEVYNSSPDEKYFVVTDIIQHPDIDYRNILSYDLIEGQDYTLDSNNNIVLNQQLVSNGALLGFGKLANWKFLLASDPKFLENYFFLIGNRVFFYNTSLQNPYAQTSQDLVKYPLSLHKNSSNIFYEKLYLVQNNTVFIDGLENSTYINSSLYIQKTGTHEIRTRLFNNSAELIGEDRFVFHIKEISNPPSPTPTPTPSPKKHTVSFDEGPIINIKNCDDCYKDFLFATINNMSEECQYYYEFGVNTYGNKNPDEPRDTTDSDDITFTVASGTINSGALTEKINTLITTGIGKIRTTLYVKVINLDYNITSIAYVTIQKCDRDFCDVTPTPTTSKVLKSYPPRTPTKTKTPTPTSTRTPPATPTPTPTTPLVPPLAPTDLSAVAGNGFVDLSWSAPSPSIVRDYIIQYSSNSGSSWITHADGVSLSTSLRISGLTNGTPYLLRVAATNGAGNGPYVTTNSAVTPMGVPPSAPSISSVIAGNTQAVVSWTVPDNGGSPITDYSVQYSSNVGSSWITFTKPSSTLTSTTVTGLTNGVSYIFRVAAVNAINIGQYSIYSSTVVPATVPGQPANVVAVATSQTVATVSWDAPTDNGGSNVTSYSVEYSSNSGSSWTPFSSTTTSLTASIVGLQTGNTYLFRVRATNRVGNSNYSTNSAPLFYAFAPSVVVITYWAPGNQSVLLNWDSPNSNGSIITDYSVQYALNNTNPLVWNNFTKPASSSTSVTVTGLTNGTQYVFRVAAVNNIGTGQYSSITPVLMPVTTPGLSTNITASNTTSGILINWTPPVNNGGSPVTSYTVTAYPFPLGTGASISQTVTVPSINFTGLQTGTTYTFGVVANNIAGAGATATYNTPILYATAPAAPTNITSSSNIDGTVTISWVAGANNGSAIASYTVGISYDRGATWATTASSPTTFFVFTPTTGTSPDDYAFRVLATNSIGSSAYTVKVNTVNWYASGRLVSMGNSPRQGVGLDGGLSIVSGKCTPSYIRYPIISVDATSLPGGSLEQVAIVDAPGRLSLTPETYGSIQYSYISNIVNSTVFSSVSYLKNSASVLFAITNTGVLYAIGYLSDPLSGTMYQGAPIYGAFPISTLGNGAVQKIVNNGSVVIAITSGGKSFYWGYITGIFASVTYPYYAFNNLLSNNTADVGIGSDFVIVVGTDGSMRGWGRNTSGSLGSNAPSTTTQYSGVTIGQGIFWKKVFCGSNYVIAIDSSNKIYGWGNNVNGQLGLGNTSNVSNPTQIGTASNWREDRISTYNNSVLAINSIGEIYAWGNNLNGLLGTGTMSSVLSPTKIENNVQNHTLVSVGLTSSYMVKNGGNLYVAGARNASLTHKIFGTDINIVKNADATQIAAGNNVSAMVKNDGSFYVTVSSSSELTPVTGLPSGGPQAIGASDNYIVCIDNLGNLYGAGSPPAGQLGTSFSAGNISVLTAVSMPAGIKFSKLAAGSTHLLLIATDGTLWGCGNGIAANNITKLSSANNWVDIAIGNNFSTAINSIGELYGFGSGWNWFGYTMNFTKITTSSNPIFKKTAAGSSHILAVDSMGRLYAMGANAAGQIGVGSTSGHYSSLYLVSQASWTNVYANSQSTYSLATNSSRDLFFWGTISNLSSCGSNFTKNTPTIVVGTVVGDPKYSWLNVAAGSDYILGVTQG